MADKKDIIDPIDATFENVVGPIAPKKSNQTILREESQFLFYGTGDGSDSIRVHVVGEDVWVTQAAISDIFGIDRSGVTKHIANIFGSAELIEQDNVQFLHIDTSKKPVKTYNLDVILSVGYRVNSRQAIRFRRWANSILREFLIKGFVMDDDRLKQGNQLFGKDYFDELLERIRDIRASERRFYQKVTEIYIQCSYDYDPQSGVTKKFFSHAQNKLEYAVTGMTAAEIIKERANQGLPNMGLTTWKNQKDSGKIRKTDTSVAKNYLAQGEIDDLNRLVSMFLDYAENLASKGKRMSMNDWWDKLDDFLKFNEYQILQNYGRIKKTTADKFAADEFTKFKPIQDADHKSDFDKVVQAAKIKGKD